MNKEKSYHYTECGLDNVYLYNISVVQDIANERTISIPAINALHKVIALGLITKKGLLIGKEIRFLRSLLGFKQSDFSSILGKEAQACGRWERDETEHDKTTDMFIRFTALNYLGYDKKLGLDNIKYFTDALPDATEKIKINTKEGNYSLMRNLAA